MEIGNVLFSNFIIISMIIGFGETSHSEYSDASNPSVSCGNISDIHFPFRLLSSKLYKYHSGNFYDLYCESNQTVLYLIDFNIYYSDDYMLYSDSSNDASCPLESPLHDDNEMRRKYKYYVEAINYVNYTIRLVAPNLKQNKNCSLFPHFPLANYLFSSNEYFQTEVRYLSANGTISLRQISQPITFLRCEERVKSLSYIEIRSPCVKSPAFYIYVVVDLDLTFSDLEDSCRIEMVTLISARNRNHKKMSSYSEVHAELIYGFELSWESKSYRCNTGVDSLRNCTLDGPSFTISFEYCGYWCNFSPLLKSFGRKVLVYIVIPRTVCVVLVIALLLYTWFTRHSSKIDGIEEFLQNNSDLMPIRYSYWEIIVMTRGFIEKLGEGGFGSVYKGTLSNGRLVAVKILGKSKGNGQDFMNEVATIGRIHHVNVVHLIGFCATISKRALVYDFMPNGSLDKYIFAKVGFNAVSENNKSLSSKKKFEISLRSLHKYIFGEKEVVSEKYKPLSCKELFEISLGVSRGISYLHQGCNMQILHFDIKPHNILLDDNLSPKVSDFGLARLCPLENSVVSMTSARGTIGYIAPELFYKNIGGVSHKSDVYSFGMLLFEMASRRRNVSPKAEKRSQIYFPTWIYDQFSEGKNVEIEEDATDDEIVAIKTMIIVALWCIQLKPCDRPSMNKVIEMLEGDFESLQMPPKPSLYPNCNVREVTESSCSTPSNENSAET